jgi:hypothetical protein
VNLLRLRWKDAKWGLEYLKKLPQVVDLYLHPPSTCVNSPSTCVNLLRLRWKDAKWGLEYLKKLPPVVDLLREDQKQLQVNAP